MNKVTVRYIILLLFIVAVQSIYGQRTIRMNLERMVSDASIIVHGTVSKVETGIDPQTKLLATFVTIEVSENFFGAADRQISLKMLGGKSAKKTVKLAEMPTFTVGEEIISLFFTPSKYGFTSPVGMAQGKFIIQTDPVSQKSFVRNGVNNTQLFSGIKNTKSTAKIAATNTSGGPIEAADFSQTIRSLVTILKK